jgi:hypothetical protein
MVWPPHAVSRREHCSGRQGDGASGRLGRRFAGRLGRAGLCGRSGALLLLVIVALAVSGCGGPAAAPERPAATSGSSRGGGVAQVEPELCLRGRASAEGIECQAFRAADGRLYTLVGDLGGLATEREVCVCGRPVEMSTCMQGTTLTIRRIGPPEACP